MAVLLITHDLAVVAQTCSRVLVMYAGRIVEEAPVDKLLRGPAHPYTRGLVRAIPRVTETAADERRRLHEIPGRVPPITERGPGCLFRQRCERAEPQCGESEPDLEGVGAGHRARCFFPYEAPEAPETLEPPEAS
jgi:peptide/nickel transport system ATP-binding protein